MDDLKRRVSELAQLMEEYRLAEAEFESDGQRIAFRRRSAPPPRSAESTNFPDADHVPSVWEPVPEPAPQAPQGTAVTSPMTGIYYGAPSPNAPPFVKEGSTVTAGQVVGLIEAMKVFNEITAAASGTVLKLVVESGELVQPGDPLMYIG